MSCHLVADISKAKLIQSNLKEVDGYKVRLITYDELMQNLIEEWNHGGVELIRLKEKYNWVNYLENYDNDSYWAMSPENNYSSRVWYIRWREDAFDQALDY